MAFARFSPRMGSCYSTRGGGGDEEERGGGGESEEVEREGVEGEREREREEAEGDREEEEIVRMEEEEIGGEGAERGRERERGGGEVRRGRGRGRYGVIGTRKRKDEEGESEKKKKKSRGGGRGGGRGWRGRGGGVGGGGKKKKKKVGEEERWGEKDEEGGKSELGGGVGSDGVGSDGVFDLPVNYTKPPIVIICSHCGTRNECKSKVVSDFKGNASREESASAYLHSNVEVQVERATPGADEQDWPKISPESALTAIAHREVEETGVDVLCCQVCFEPFGAEMTSGGCTSTRGLWTSFCGHAYCRCCVEHVSRERQRKVARERRERGLGAEKNPDSDPPFKCPCCRRFLRVADFYKVHLESYVVLTGNSRARIRDVIERVKNGSVQAAKSVLETWFSEMTIPTVSKPGSVGTITLKTARSQFCASAVERERYNRVKMLRSGLRRVSTDLSLVVASIHKEETDSKTRDLRSIPKATVITRAEKANQLDSVFGSPSSNLWARAQQHNIRVETWIEEQVLAEIEQAERASARNEEAVATQSETQSQTQTETQAETRLDGRDEEGGEGEESVTTAGAVEVASAEPVATATATATAAAAAEAAADSVIASVASGTDETSRVARQSAAAHRPGGWLEFDEPPPPRAAVTETRIIYGSDTPFLPGGLIPMGMVADAVAIFESDPGSYEHAHAHTHDEDLRLLAAMGARTDTRVLNGNGWSREFEEITWVGLDGRSWSRDRRGSWHANHTPGG